MKSFEQLLDEREPTSPDIKKQELKSLKDIYFGFYNKLPNEACEWAKENFDNLKVNHNFIPTNLYEAVGGAFLWEKTPQGYTYWVELSNGVYDLMNCYYELYNQLPAEQREKARKNWDYKYAIEFPAPKNLLDAILYGFHWLDTKEGFEFWENIYLSIRQEIKNNKCQLIMKS